MSPYAWKDMKPRGRCANGCGRKTNSRICSMCLQGHGVPEPMPELLSNEYLALCVREAAKRASELRARASLLGMEQC